MDSASGDPVGAVTWMIRGQWVTLSIRAAVELGVFDRLEAPTSVADLAVEIGCDPGALARLVRVLVDLGLVEFSGVEAGVGDEVSLTAGGGTLSRGHASGLRELALMQSSLANLASWQRLADAVRTGGAVFEEVNGIDPWQFLASNPDQEAIFNAAMARRGSDQAAAITPCATFPAFDWSSTLAVVEVPCSPNSSPAAQAFEVWWPIVPRWLPPLSASSLTPGLPTGQALPRSTSSSQSPLRQTPTS